MFWVRCDHYTETIVSTMEDKEDKFIEITSGIRIKTSIVVKTIFWVFILFIVGFTYKNYFGNNTIGSWLEKPEHSTQYWVYVQLDNVESKNYRVKADIERSEGNYFMNTVYWPNGGHSNFDDCNITSLTVSVNNDERCSDNESQRYNIRLGEKFYSKLKT